MTIGSMPGLGEDDLKAEDRSPLRKTMSTLGRFIGACQRYGIREPDPAAGCCRGTIAGSWRESPRARVSAKSGVTVDEHDSL